MDEEKDAEKSRGAEERVWRKMMGGGGGGEEGGAEGRLALSLFAQQQQQDNGLSPLRILTGTGLFLANWNIRYG